MCVQSEQSDRKINSSSLLRIGPISTINKWFSVHTREWDRRGHLGMDPVSCYVPCTRVVTLGLYKKISYYLSMDTHPTTQYTLNTGSYFTHKVGYTPNQVTTLPRKWKPFSASRKAMGLWGLIHTYRSSHQHNFDYLV